LIQEERKTLRLTVYPNLKIVLYTPLDHPKEKIESFLKRKYLWITKQVKDLKRLQRDSSGREYISGESVLYLGRQYKLVIKKSLQDLVHFESGKIIVETTSALDNSVKNKELLEQWYTKRAESVFRTRYKQMLKKFNYDFAPELSLRKMQKRWGSFLTKKKVLLNPELIKASKECIDYVIIHELCHMKHQDHSAAYYRFLNSKCPNWKGIKNQLELRFSNY
jgi:predicted metal-dependent hydrolase